MSRLVTRLLPLLALSAVTGLWAPATPAAGETTPVLRLGSQTTWIEPEGMASVTLRVSDAPPGSTVVATLQDRIRSRTDFRQSLAGQRSGRVLGTSSPVAVPQPEPAGAVGTAQLTLPLRAGPGSAEAVLVRTEGVYPLEVSLLGPGGSTLASLTTHVVRLPETFDHPHLGVAAVQVLNGAPSLQPDGSIRVDSELRTALTLAASSLAPHPELPVTLSLTPETIAALARLGHPLDLELVEEISAAARRGSIPASPFVDLDIDAMVRAGLGEEIGHQLALGATTISRTLGTSVDPGLWVAGETLTPLALGELARRGVTQVVVHEEILEPLDPELFEVTLSRPFELDAGRGQRVVALATDPLLQSHAGSSGDDVLDAQNLLSDLAVLYFDRPAYQRGVAILLQPGDTSPAFLDTFLEGLAGSPLLEARTASDAIQQAELAPAGGTDAPVAGPEDRLVRRLVPNRATADLSRLAEDLSLARFGLGSFASTFGADHELVGELTTRLAVTPSSLLLPADRRAYFEAAGVETAALLGSLGLPVDRTVTLPARDGTLPLTLLNQSGSPARVVLHLESEKLDLLDGDRLELVLEEPSTTIDIPVRARASGAFPLLLRLESPDGSLVLAEARYTIRSAAFSGLGLALSVFAGLFLAGWWVRTALRARAAHLSAQAGKGHPSASSVTEREG